MPKTKKPMTTSRDRVVYEVTSGAGTNRVEAATTAELREALTPLLPGVEPYAVQAVARLASTERATVTTSGWSVRRVGVLVFQADEPPAARSQKAEQHLAPTADPEGASPAPQEAQEGEQRPAVTVNLGALSPAPQDAPERRDGTEIDAALDSLTPPGL